MYKTVIFDLDGLLIDSEKISYQLYQDLLSLYGHTFLLDKYVQNYSGKTAIGNMESLIEEFSLPISLEEGLAFIQQHETSYIKQGVPLKKGACELLEYLKMNNYQIVLATSSIKERAMTILKQNHIDHYFDEMVFGSEVSRGKPYPDIFLKACGKTHTSSKEALVLEDSEAGIRAAHLGHIPVICIPDMKQPGSTFKQMTEKILPCLNDVIYYLKLHHHYQMIALDMDGTLLNSDKKISQKSQEVIKKAIEKGKIVVFNTGRCPAELFEYFDQLDEIRYLNCISGALVYDRKTKKTIACQTLDTNTVKTLFEISSLENTMIQLLTEESHVQENQINKMADYGMGVYIPMYQRVTKKAIDLKKEFFQQPFPVEKMNIYHTCREDREKTRQRIKEKNLLIEMADAELTSIEISPLNIHKGKGLTVLCQYLNIPLSDVIVVGDGDNDREALKIAGLAVVMDNAKESVKQLADVIVSDNDHDGCVEAIERYLL